ncbi:MAG: hypothetical protein LBI27_01195 [Clostridiales bacterium]|jgi:hypothetical protein|nr:hypothetical protein [Clostridiales bacterium]
MILQVLLWIVAAISAFVLLIIILLAIPIKYNVAASYDEKKTFLNLNASYLFNFLRVSYKYKNGRDKLVFQIAWFKFGTKKKKKPKKIISSREEIIPQEKIIPPEKTEKPPELKKETPVEEKKTEESILKKFKGAYDVLTEIQVKTMIKYVFTALKKIAVLLRPKYFDAVSGFESPVTTGVVIGRVDAAAGMFRFQNFRIAGDFNAEAFNARVKMRGNINILRLSLPMIRLATRKPIFALIIKMLRKG